MLGDPQLRPLASARSKSKKKKPDPKGKLRGPKIKFESDSMLASLVVLDQDGVEEALWPPFRPDGVHAFRNERPLPTDAQSLSRRVTRTWRSW